MKLRDVIDIIPAMAWTHRPDGTSLFVNKYWAEYTGLFPEEVGSGWTEAFHPEDRKTSRETGSDTLVSGEPFEYELGTATSTGRFSAGMEFSRASKISSGNAIEAMSCVADRPRELTFIIWNFDADAPGCLVLDFQQPYLSGVDLPAQTGQVLP